MSATFHKSLCILNNSDFQALAIGYSSGCVCIVDIEDKEILHKFQLGSDPSVESDDDRSHGVTCITWPVRLGTEDSATDYNVYVSMKCLLTQ